MGFQKSKINFYFFLLFFILIFVFCIFVKKVNAAGLYFSPSSGNYNVGQNFSVSVYVSSPEQAINAVSGVVSFPPDKLKVISLSKKGSIFSFWVKEPLFSNSAGTIDFEGVVFNPGFLGSAGKIITISFQTKTAGQVSINFLSASVLANDGKGTNILTNTGSGSYTVQQQKYSASPKPTSSGGVTSFLLSDNEPPQPFKIEIKEGRQTTNPSPTLFFETTDKISGIDHYEIIIDGKEPIKTQKSELKIPSQDLGKHTIIVKAIDKAGNETLAITEVEILPIPSPVITDFPRILLAGSPLFIKGKTLPEVMLNIYIQKENEETKIEQTKADKEGNWFFVSTTPLKVGTYNLFLEAIDSLGARSLPSEKITIKVVSGFFIKIGKLTLSYLNILIAILFLVVISGIIFGWQKIKQKKRVLKKEIGETERVLYKAFKTLKEETEKQIAKLDGKPDLSEREKEIYDELKKILKTSEKLIAKEIKDIKKEI